MKSREDIKTTFLLQELKESKSIYQFIQDNFEIFSETVFSEYLNQIIFRRRLCKSELFMQSGLSKSYAYAILSGSRKPSNRNLVLQLALAVRADLEETQNLLIYSQFTPLSPKNKRDAAIIFAIEQNLNAYQLNDLLFDLELEELM